MEARLWTDVGQSTESRTSKSLAVISQGRAPAADYKRPSPSPPPFTLERTLSCSIRREQSLRRRVRMRLNARCDKYNKQATITSFQERYRFAAPALHRVSCDQKHSVHVKTGFDSIFLFPLERKVSRYSAKLAHSTCTLYLNLSIVDFRFARLNNLRNLPHVESCKDKTGQSS